MRELVAAHRIPATSVMTVSEFWPDAAALLSAVAAFIAHFGRPPDHIDGHHHIHQLPGGRDV